VNRTEHRLAAAATAAAVGLQVVLPRLFSVLLWYHLGFLAVSLGMLGFAFGGVLVARRVRLTGQPGGGLDLPWLATLAALCVPAGLALVVRLPIEPAALLADAGSALALLATGLLLAIPLALLGTLVCSALDRHRERPGGLYGATFLGGALGALVALAAMQWMGGPRAAGLLVLPLLALAVLQRPERAARPLVAAAATLIVLLLAVPDRVLPLTSRKHFPAVPDELVLEERWNAFSHVTIYENPEHHGLWAVPGTYRGVLPRTIGMAIDAWAITPIVERRPGHDHHPFLAAYPPTLFYELMQPGFRVLVIGAGGGIDVQAALAAGAGHVTAVEINPLIVDAVRGRFADFCGDLYRDPRVEVVVAEGRHFLERDQRRYDLIVMSGVDTFAATEAGAFALSENHLYTVEGLAACLRRLEPGGMLGITRWWFEPPRQTLRLALTAARVLREQGLPHPEWQLFVARAERNSLTLVKNGVIGDDERERLLAACRSRGATPVYCQEVPSHPTLVEALSVADPRAFIGRYPYRVDPATDDRPFFFETSRVGSLFRAEGDWIRDRLGGQEVLVLSLALLLLLSAPVLWLGRGGPAERGGSGRTGALPAFLLLGAGYMLVEVPTLQRLTLWLGHPVLAVAVVLVALLLWSGLGSLLADRLPGRWLPWITIAAGSAVVLLLISAHGPLVAAVAGRPLPVRIAAAVALLAVPGLAMGMPFPLALRTLGGSGAVIVPSAFLWNGLASVVSGPLAVMVAMEQGFEATLWSAAACYVGAALLFRRRMLS
jgi:hypothetical protein